jgi:hypothetical protein
MAVVRTGIVPVPLLSVVRRLPKPAVAIVTAIRLSDHRFARIVPRVALRNAVVGTLRGFGPNQIQPPGLLIGPGVPDHDEDRQQDRESRPPHAPPRGEEGADRHAVQSAQEESQCRIRAGPCCYRKPAGGGRVQHLEIADGDGQQRSDAKHARGKHDAIAAEGELAELPGASEAGHHWLPATDRSGE